MENVIKRNEEYVPPEGTEPSRLVASAIHKNGRIWTGKRHGFLIPIVFYDTGEMVYQEDQGFWTDDGRFLTREQACPVAIKAGQIDKSHEGVLLSEHLW